MTHDRENPLLEVAGERELLLVFLLLRFLRLASLVDVDAAADETRKGASFVGVGNTAIEDPAVHAVVPPEAVFHFERLAPVEVIEVVRYAPLEVVGVDARCPPVAHLLLDRAAGEREPGLVEVVAVRIDAGTPEHDRRMLNQ